VLINVFVQDVHEKFTVYVMTSVSR